MAETLIVGRAVGRDFPDGNGGRIAVLSNVDCEIDAGGAVVNLTVADPQRLPLQKLPASGQNRPNVAVACTRRNGKGREAAQRTRTPNAHVSGFAQS